MKAFRKPLYIVLLFALSFGCSTKHETREPANKKESTEENEKIIRLDEKIYQEIDTFVESQGPSKPLSFYDDEKQFKEKKEKVRNKILNNISKNFEEYIVHKGDTLMLISFKIYRDVSRWKDIYSWNKDRVDGDYTIREGMKLRFKPETVDVQWPPVGSPYLIKRGDNLGTISQDVYGTMRYWPELHENNEFLIKDPDVIYAGFTIYTPKKSYFHRGPASEKNVKESKL